MMQVPVRAWPADAVHDTIAAVMRTAPFQRSLQGTILERLLTWMGQGLAWLSRHVGGLPGARTVVVWFAGVLVLLVVARVFLAARARDPQVRAGRSPGGVRPGEDPWRAAERLTATGHYEGAAHALYRGVLASVGERERLRLDPSKTSGDYARELGARGSGVHQPFRLFVRRFDAAVYGHGQIDAALVADLTRLALPLRAGARAA